MSSIERGDQNQKIVPTTPDMKGWRHPRQQGFQRHHLIPAVILAKPQVMVMMTQLQRSGYDVRQFRENGLLLPSDEVTAWRLGHAMHRGPHPGYTAVVGARVDTIVRHHQHAERAEDDAVAIWRLRLLQRAVRRALTDRHRMGFFLNRRDPMRLFADRTYLDMAIDRLFGD